MKIIHTADWHLGKLIQGTYMTDDQRYVLQQLVQCVKEERPDAVIIAGDLYDRAIPPVEAIDLLNDLLEQIVIELSTPVLAISGNHDSPDRLNFATRMMEQQGLYLAGQLREYSSPIVLRDEYGEVHFHLIPYTDPAQIRFLYQDDTIRTHQEAAEAIMQRVTATMDPTARHVWVGHAFVTPGAEPKLNTSDSERPLSIGGAEFISAELFRPFHYTALGHLHQAHYVLQDNIRYAGSPLKYSLSEEHHHKGYYIVHMDGNGQVEVEKRDFRPLRDIRRVTGYMEEIEQHERSEDYVFVTLLNENPVLFPMEKVRAIYPNALHVERRISWDHQGQATDDQDTGAKKRHQTDPIALFAAFYEEVKGLPLEQDKQRMFAEVYAQVLREEGGHHPA